MPPKRHADPLEVVAARAPAPAAAGHVPDADPDAALLALGFQKFQRMEAKELTPVEAGLLQNMENLFLNQALQTRLLLALQKKTAATWTAEQLFAAEKHDFMAAVNKFIGLQLDATVEDVYRTSKDKKEQFVRQFLSAEPLQRLIASKCNASDEEIFKVFWKSFDNNYNSKKSKLRVWAARAVRSLPRTREAVDAGFVDANGNANAQIEDMEDVSEGDRAARVLNAVALSLGVNFPQLLLSDDVKGRIASWIMKLAAQKDRPSWLERLLAKLAASADSSNGKRARSEVDDELEAFAGDDDAGRPSPAKKPRLTGPASASAGSSSNAASGSGSGAGARLSGASGSAAWQDAYSSSLSSERC